MTRRGGLNFVAQQQRSSIAQEELDLVIQHARLSGVHELKISDIDIQGDWNPRGVTGGDPYSEEALSGLMAAMKDFGQLQPVIVRPHPDPQQGSTYQLVAGWRRFHSRRLLGDPVVSALVVPLEDHQLQMVATMENTQREELTQFETVRGVFYTLGAQLKIAPELVPARMSRVLKSGEDPDDLADKLRTLTSSTMSTFLTKHARVLRLRQEESLAVYRGAIAPSSALELVRLGDRPERSVLLEQACEQGWSARTTRRKINEILDSSKVLSSPIDQLARQVSQTLAQGSLGRLNSTQQDKVRRLLQQLDAVLISPSDDKKPSKRTKNQQG